VDITILNGDPQAQTRLNQYLDELCGLLDQGGHRVNPLVLRDLKIQYCSGCWDCWVKTPGECVACDDSQIVRRSVIHSDLTLLASPVIMGFPSALLKKTCDKFVPLVHPYVTLVNGEVHHISRYTHYPKLALLLERRPDTNDEDIRIIHDIFSRTALNFKSTLAFTRQVTDPVEEVCHEIDRI